MSKRYGLIGKNIDYSFSRAYFAEKFEKLNDKESVYVNFDLQNLLTRKSGIEIKMLLSYSGSLFFSVYCHKNKSRWSSELFLCRVGTLRCLQGGSVPILWVLDILFFRVSCRNGRLKLKRLKNWKELAKH